MSDSAELRAIAARDQLWGDIYALVGAMPVDRRDEEGNFLGFVTGKEIEHRTVGAHRAWSHESSEWCYPDEPRTACGGRVDATDIRAILEKHS